MRRFVILVSVICLLVLGAARAHALTIEEVQAAIKRAEADWTAGDNEVWRLHRDLGWYTPTWEFPPPLTGSEELYLPMYDPRSLPTHLDWREVNDQSWVTKPKNQYQCGSCWAFATTGPIESHIAIAEEWPDPEIDLSEQQMLSCDDSPGNMGCNGGFTTTSFNYVKTTGLFDEECLPYHASDSWPCDDRCDDWQDRLFKIDSWKIVGKWGGLGATPQDIMDALQNGPLGTSMVIYEDFETYTGGTYTTVIGIPLGTHAVTIIGYDSDEGVWYCKNSWGTFWGEDGFFTIKWGAGLIGMFTILPHYTSQNIGPWPDDDDTVDDDATDDDQDDDADDDGDDDATDCQSFCDRLEACQLLDDLGLATADECLAKCSQVNAEAFQCVLDAANCSETAECVGASGGSGDDDDHGGGGFCAA